MQVYFIRHAESTWNAFGDRSKNTPITENGKEQAKSISGYVDIVICSTLLRAKETLENSNLKYNKVVYTDICREVRGGTPCDYMEDENIENIETDEQVNKRIDGLKKMVAELIENNKNIIIGIVSHYCFMQKITNIGMFNCQVLKHLL
jgi:broad specificity phosphatase PhoE